MFKIKSDKKILLRIFGLGGIIGAFLFIFIYGVRVLDVAYDEWLLTGGDLSQHYLGWIFYRKSSWSFPVGLVEGILNPEKISIMYLDSIPILAIIFKIFSPILPTTFQYFGIWGIFSFIMQGGIAALIAGKYTKNYCAIGSVSGILVLSSTVLQRMFGHTALAGQWIILLGIYVWICNIENDRKRIWIWNALLVLAVYVHMYFVPMILSMAFFDSLRKKITGGGLESLFDISL